MNLTTQPIKKELTLDHLGTNEIQILGDSILDLLGFSGVDLGRATHYNTTEELDKARSEIHRKVFGIDRSIYSIIFCLDGVTENSRRKSILALLGNPRDNDNTMFNTEEEVKIVSYIANSMQNNKMINAFLDLTSYKDGKRINNARTRRIVLSSILNHPNIELWSVKYKNKLSKILTHMWGTKVTGVIRKILTNNDHKNLNRDDSSFVKKHITRYIDELIIHVDKDAIFDCVAFILGIRGNSELPLLKAFENAKSDIKHGAPLPLEVLEGIASQYHPNVTKADLLNLANKAKTITTKQAKNIQRVAKQAGVKVKFDPLKSNMVDLYIYAFEMGMSNDITNALEKKAEKVSGSLPFRYNNIGILVDDSESERGSETQKLRPLASTLATRDVLFKCGLKRAHIATVSKRSTTPFNLMRPVGDTSLAEGLIALLQKEPDAVFVISDGYENAPSGRFHEALSLARKIGCRTPVYHVNPVASSDSGHGTRQLSKNVPVIPVNKPESIGLGLFKAALAADPEKGIISLVQSALGQIEKQNIRKVASMAEKRRYLINKKGGK